MTQRLKSWESPRRQGRNDKGKGGAARRRQIKKQMKLLRRKLKGETITKQTQNLKQTLKENLKENLKQNLKQKEGVFPPSFFYVKKDKQFMTEIKVIG